jgi:UDP-N-acetylglucosamine--N-acetylmuramyl-(pentapeptide) pyrophosphoryl-undecaprenol N-acetylglucosamine transferase
MPGVVNRLAARWARVVATTFEATAGRLPERTRVVRTGNPVRREIAAVALERPRLRGEALRVFELDDERSTVSVFGGSQGARQLDRVVAGAVVELRRRGDLQLLVAAGPANVGELAHEAGTPADLRVHVHGFIERMDLALAVSDVAVARAGSGTISELAVCGVPSILVPYPHATEDHQVANAREVERAGGADVVLEAALTPALLADLVAELLPDEARRSAMRAAMLEWARPDADVRIAELVLGEAA